MDIKLSAEEVVTVLQQGLRNELPVHTVTYSWDTVGSGVCSFYFGDWLLTFFNDDDCIDYCDSAVSPDGRIGDLDEWEQGVGSAGNPVDKLSEDEYNQLESLLKRAVPKEQQ